MKRAKSILQFKEECFVCRTTQNLAPHEIFFGTSDRTKSLKYGLWIYLCDRHHTASSVAVHKNPKLDKALKKYGQEIFEKYYDPKGHEFFMSIFKKNYLEGNEDYGKNDTGAKH